MTNAPAPAHAELPGVYAAAVTPLAADGTLDLDGLPALLDHLAARGCHGALLLGTTGEGTSFSVEEHLAVVREGLRYRAGTRPDFRILAGTGAASLSDAIAMTKGAFDLGADAVVTLPPFYYKGLTPAGLVRFFAALITAAVPADGRVIGYHIPQMSGVALPAAALTELRARYPRQFYGIKDSQDELAHTLGVIKEVPGLGVFAGSDSIIADALVAGSAGAITALANVLSPLDRAVWEAHQAGQSPAAPQALLHQARLVVKGLSTPAIQKAALHDLFGLPDWAVRPPLEPLDPAKRTATIQALGELLS